MSFALLLLTEPMMSIAIQTPSAPRITSSRFSLPGCPPGVFRDSSSLSFSRNLGSFDNCVNVSLLDARFPRLTTVWCCYPDHLSTNGSATAIDWSATAKGFAEADEKAQALLLKRKGNEIVRGLKGTCIYLIGMMGSGKTTVGKLLAEALDYEFLDSDKLVEDAAGGITVAQFFKEQNEEKFRNAETEVLKKVSHNGRSVVATGGGIVVRPLNWSYLKVGVTVWLDVPLDALAERVVAVGTHTRPLLADSQGDSAHSKALAKLLSIYELRAPFYAQADVIVSLQELAEHLGYQHVRDLTPMMIACQVLEETDEMIAGQKQADIAPAA